MGLLEVILGLIAVIIAVIFIIIYIIYKYKVYLDLKIPRNCKELYGTPPFQPSKWNDDTTIRYNNNCYNYAANIRTDSFAQPGEASGKKYSQLNCSEVTRGAISDGLSSKNCDEECGNNCHKVALVIWPGRDFHWYRLDGDGTWSHKPGSTPATNLDNSGNIITDPRNADRGLYTVFCGCFCVCKCNVTIT